MFSSELFCKTTFPTILFFFFFGKAGTVAKRAPFANMFRGVCVRVRATARPPAHAALTLVGAEFLSVTCQNTHSSRTDRALSVDVDGDEDKSQEK